MSESLNGSFILIDGFSNKVAISSETQYFGDGNATRRVNFVFSREVTGCVFAIVQALSNYHTALITEYGAFIGKNSTLTFDYETRLGTLLGSSGRNVYLDVKESLNITSLTYSIKFFLLH